MLPKFLVFRLAVLLPLVALFLASSDPIGAEPYIAFRTGLKCGACHTNKTGGGKRTSYGFYFTQTDVEALWSSATENAGDFSAEINDHISLGADFIASNQTRFSVEETFKANGRDSTHTQDSQNGFGIESGSLYIEAALVPETITLYIDETVAPGGASNREAFVLLQNLPLNGYFKAGRMLLPYGIRIWDDQSFIRQVTGFNYDNQDMGVEVGIEPKNLFLSVALSNGTQGSRDNNLGKQISSTGALYFNRLTVGGSFSWNKAGGNKRLLAGPYAALTLGQVTLMGEVDWLRDSGTTDRNQFIAFGSLEYWLRQSINFRLAFDFVDPYDDLAEDESSRITIGVDSYLTPFLIASAHYKVHESIPQDLQGNADALVLGLHAFF